MHTATTAGFAPTTFDQEPADLETPQITSTEGDIPAPRRLRVPEPVLWTLFILSVILIVAGGLWGLGQTTWTYSTRNVDRATGARIARLHAQLQAAGVAEQDLRRLAAATRPNTNVGDAVEMLADTNKLLALYATDPAITAARQELLDILQDLERQRYGPQTLPYEPPSLPTPTIPYRSTKPLTGRTLPVTG